MYSTIRNDTIIEELKLQRKVAMDHFHSVNLIKNNGIAEFFYTRFQNGTDVPFAILENMPIGVALVLPVVYGGAIVTTKLEDKSDKVAMYSTDWTPGSTLTWHYHSDCTEEIIVTTGKVKIYVQGSVHILTPTQKLVIGVGIGHQVTALEETKLNIKFVKVP